jgi:hypothetical protein
MRADDAVMYGVRTTFNIDDALLDRAHQVAAQTRRSLGDIVDDALRVLFAARTPNANPVTVTLPTYGGSGLQGVDLEGKEALAELLDEEHGQRVTG